jgi:hypothetical protein
LRQGDAFDTKPKQNCFNFHLHEFGMEAYL